MFPHSFCLGLHLAQQDLAELAGSLAQGGECAIGVKGGDRREILWREDMVGALRTAVKHHISDALLQKGGKTLLRLLGKAGASQYASRQQTMELWVVFHRILRYKRLRGGQQRVRGAGVRSEPVRRRQSLYNGRIVSLLHLPEAKRPIRRGDVISFGHVKDGADRPVFRPREQRNSMCSAVYRPSQPVPYISGRAGDCPAVLRIDQKLVRQIVFVVGARAAEKRHIILRRGDNRPCRLPDEIFQRNNRRLDGSFFDRFLHSAIIPPLF